MCVCVCVCVCVCDECPFGLCVQDRFCKLFVAGCANGFKLSVSLHHEETFAVSDNGMRQLYQHFNRIVSRSAPAESSRSLLGLNLFIKLSQLLQSRSILPTHSTHGICYRTRLIPVKESDTCGATHEALKRSLRSLAPKSVLELTTNIPWRTVRRRRRQLRAQTFHFVTESLKLRYSIYMREEEPLKFYKLWTSCHFLFISPSTM